MLSVGGACPGLAATNPGLQKIVSGTFGLPLGLLLSVMAGGELFPSNTAFVTAAAIEKKADVKDLVKNFVFSYAGNLVGSFLMAWLAFNGGTLGDGEIFFI